MAALGQLSAEPSRVHVPIVATATDLGPATVLLIDAANRGTPVLEVRRHSRFGRELRSLLDRSLRELPACQPLTAASTA